MFPVCFSSLVGIGRLPPLSITLDSTLALSLLVLLSPLLLVLVASLLVYVDGIEAEMSLSVGVSTVLVCDPCCCMVAVDVAAAVDDLICFLGKSCLFFTILLAVVGVEEEEEVSVLLQYNEQQLS